MLRNGQRHHKNGSVERVVNPSCLVFNECRTSHQRQPSESVLIWRFLKSRSVTTEQVEKPTGESQAKKIGPSPAMGSFRFESNSKTERFDTESNDTLVDSSPNHPLDVDVASVVREKTRGARKLRIMTERGIAPVVVPSLRQKALLYKLAAQEAAHHAPMKASALWEAYLELLPLDAAGWFEFGQVLLGTGSLGEAARAFERASSLNPEDGLSFGARGYVAGALGKVQEAVRHYNKAVELRPGCLDMLEALAGSLEATGDLAGAARTRHTIEMIQSESHESHQ